jgi:hypothetical protein
MASQPFETGFRLHRNAGWALAAILLTGASAAEAQKRCDWHGPRSRGETSYKQCVDYAALNGKTLDLPSNVSRISHDGISFCANTFTAKGGAADIIYLMDNSGSMESGESSGGFNTPPGDPFGVRDRVIRRAMRQHRASVDTGTAGFISFFGLSSNQNYVTTPEIETNKLQRPLEIGLLHPQGEQNLTTLTRKVWKHNSSEALLPKVSAEAKAAKTALTFWSESLLLARAWLKPESAFVKTQNHAIILLSDGAIGDWKEVEALAPTLPPVYGIHLGDSTKAQHLKDLCTLTKGQFFVVSPTDTAVFATVMSRIVGIITKNPLPREVTVTNKSLPVPQVSKSLEMVANPDGSLGMVLDSIIGLKTGANQVDIQVTKDDGSVTTWSFGLNVAAAPITATGGNFTCYDMPRIQVVDADGDSLPVYPPDATKLAIELSRSASELKGVTLGAASESGDTENLPLKAPTSALGYPVHQDDIKFNGKDASPTDGNGTLEVGNSGNVTLSWSHPRDPREFVSYILLGKVVPVLVAKIDIVGPKEPVQGVDIKNPPKGADPIVILDKNGKCTGANCDGGVPDIVLDKDVRPNLPRWDAIVRSPVRITMKIFDNLGQFVNESKQELTADQWDALPKEGDSARVSIHFLPIAKEGQPLGTGAYLMKMDIQGIGGKLQRNSSGEVVEMRAVRQEYFKRFGYVR